MLELLTVGTWLFWVLFVIFSIIVLVSTEAESKGVLVISTLIFAALFYKSWSKVDLDFKTFAIYCGSYIGVGMVWTIIKWWLHVKRVQLTISQLPTGQRDTYEIDRLRKNLDPVQNKARITTWGVYWPWSMIWSAIHDIVDMAFQALLRGYRSISAGALKELEAKVGPPRA